jgi:hypothetical protein
MDVRFARQRAVAVQTNGSQLTPEYAVFLILLRGTDGQSLFCKFFLRAPLDTALALLLNV